MSFYNRHWNVQASSLARKTRNPIREFLEDLEVKTNPKKSFIPLSVGDPTRFGNLQPPAEILDAVRDSLNMKEGRSYGPLIGLHEARKAVIEYSGIPGVSTPEDVIMCNGCSHALDLVVSTLAEAGQNILVPRPGYAIYNTLGDGLGIQIKFYDLLPKDNWKVDLDSLERLVDKDTVAIVVNNPSNPCGSVYTKTHLREILQVASRNHLPIIADEIYEHFVFSNVEFVPIAALSEDVPVFTCSGLTKRFLVPGWRLGWVIVHDRSKVLGQDVRKAMSNMSSRILGASTLIQQALPRILRSVSHSFFKDMMLFIENQANIVYKELRAAPGLRPIMPQGSMYMMVQIEMTMFPEFKKELHFITEMCSEQSVLCMPGKCFNYPGFMRLVLTTPEDLLIEACHRMVEFCTEHAVPPKIGRIASYK